MTKKSPGSFSNDKPQEGKQVIAANRGGVWADVHAPRFIGDDMAKKRLKMGTSTEVRRAVNRINNMVLNGELDARTANALLYGCNVCLNAIRTDDQQAKLNELERLMREFEQNGH